MNLTDSEQGPEEGTKSFVVNLCAATTPVALVPPDGPEFEGFQCIVTRRREEGRDRFRLQLGYFSSLAAARDKAEDLRRHYPMAWAGPAPRGSAAPGQPAIDDTLAGLSNVREVLAALGAGETETERTVLTPVQELALLEPGRLPEPCFAVQLAWSDRPIDPTILPQPALFDVYTLYNVEGTRAGQRWYGLRLGFFRDVDAAKRVACYLKPEFAAVVVVPVTAQERECASGESGDINPAPMPAPGMARNDAVVDAFQAEPSMLPARLGATVAETPARPAPFELLPTEAVATPASPPAKPTQASTPTSTAKPAPRRPAGKRVVAPRRVAEPGRAAPDTGALESLGASALQMAEETQSPASSRSTSTKSASSATASAAPRARLGLAKWFGRRSA